MNNIKYNILTCYYKPKPGGFCKRLFRAINALLDKGHIVHYLAVEPFPIQHPNCHFYRFPWPFKNTNSILFWVFFHLLAPINLFYLSIKYNINKLFVFGNNYSFIMQPIRCVFRIPLTTFIRADSIENLKLKKRSSLLVYMEHVLEGLALYKTRLYCVSDSLTNSVINRHRLLKPSIFGTLRNNINTSNFYINNNKFFSRPLKVGCAGILEKRKNQSFLLEAMKLLEKNIMELYFYGIGPDENLLKQIVEENNLLDRVHFMGWVDSVKIWSDIDLLVLPSLHEGAPNVLLEAISNKVPVLASDLPEHREILPNFVLFSLQSVHELNEKLIAFADNYKLMYDRFTNRIISTINHLNFDWDKKIIDLIIN